MKILVSTFPDLKKIYPQRPHHLLQHLSKNHEVTVLSVNAGWLKEKDDNYLEKTLGNIEYIYLTNKHMNPVLQELIYIKKQKILDEKNFDLHINFHSIFGGYMLRKLSTPTLFDICDDISSWMIHSPRIPLYFKPILKSLIPFLINKNFENSDKITYSATNLKNLYFLDPEKSVFIPNGVDTKIFNLLEKKHFDNLDEFTLGFIGFLGDWIEFEEVFRAIKKLRDKFEIKLLIVGEGNRFCEFKELSKDLGIEDNVEFRNSVEYNLVPEIISHMDACLIPFDDSFVSQNALPLKLFEYMACEKPVISKNLLTIKNIVGDRVFYFNDSNDLEDLIIKLHNDKIDKTFLREGRQFVDKNYSWEKICKKFEKIAIETSKNGVIP